MSHTHFTFFNLCLTVRGRARYKRTQLERLSDLVKRRAEIETEIEAQLQSLKELYEDASKAMDMAAAKLSTV